MLERGYLVTFSLSIGKGCKYVSQIYTDWIVAGRYSNCCWKSSPKYITSRVSGNWIGWLNLLLNFKKAREGGRWIGLLKIDKSPKLIAVTVGCRFLIGWLKIPVNEIIVILGER